jgi:hypothetical protein
MHGRENRCPRSDPAADRSLALALALPPRCFARLVTWGGACGIGGAPAKETLKTGMAATVPGTAAMVVTPQGPLRTQGSSLGTQIKTNIKNKCVLRTVRASSSVTGDFLLRALG